MTPRILGRLAAVAVPVALMLGLNAVESAAPFGAHAAMLLGFTVLTAYLAGALAAEIGLPRMTGYILVGTAIGPSALAVLDANMVDSFRTIDEIALALIALTAGGELKLGMLRRTLRSIVGITLGVLVVVLVGIGALIMIARPFVPLLATQPIGFSLALALLFGIWSANSSPDATIAVISETAAQGEVTETILGATILKDVLVIVSLAAALSITGPLVDPGASFDASLLGRTAWEVAGAGLVGGLAGWGFSVYLERIGARSVLATLVFAYVLTLLAAGLHVELLLAAVAAGIVIENFSEAGDRLIHAIEGNAVVIFAIFFALAGATLDLSALARFWTVAVVLVGVRAALTWLGAHMGARAARAPAPVTRLSWLGLISQAGVTLGLALLVGRELPALGDDFVAIAMAIIIFHMLFGPVLLKVALVRAGETRAQEAKVRLGAPI